MLGLGLNLDAGMLRGGSSGASGPPVTANLIMRLDASTLAGSNGSAVAAWPDLSAGGTNSATGVNSPTLVTSAQNSLNAVRLVSASSQHFTLRTGMLTGLTAGTVVLAYKGTGSVGGGPILGDFGSDAQSNHFPFTDNAIYEDFMTTARNNSAGMSYAPLGTQVRTVGHTVTMRSKAGEWKIRLAGNASATFGANTVGVNTGTTYIGRTGSLYLQADLFEILLYGAALTDSDVLLVEAYLTSKWAL